MIRRPPRSTLDRSSAASDVYKRQEDIYELNERITGQIQINVKKEVASNSFEAELIIPVSYTHLRAHETVLDLVCRLLLEQKKTFTT